MFVGPNSDVNGKMWITVINDPEGEKYPIVHGCLHFEVVDNGNFLPVLCFLESHGKDGPVDSEEYRGKVSKYKELIKQRAKVFLNSAIVLDNVHPDDINMKIIKLEGKRL